MSIEFLSGRQLSKAILKVIDGENIRCAVAFWGETLVDSLQTKSCIAIRLRKAKIVCNLAMGGTNPRAIRALGAPDKPEIRHDDNLHAKVYLSDAGMVVSSANASANGIGVTHGPAAFIEAGSFFPPQSKQWAAALVWFDNLFNDAAIVDEKTLVRAERLLSSQWDLRERPHLPGSLFDFVARNANGFKSIGFVITETETTEEEREIVRKDAIKKNPGEKDAVNAIDDNWMYIDWEHKDISLWPHTFISMHLNEDRELVEVCGGEVKFCSSEKGYVLADGIHWNQIRKLMPHGAPLLSMIKQTDGETAWNLLRAESEETGGVMFPNAQELARALAMLDG